MRMKFAAGGRLVFGLGCLCGLLSAGTGQGAESRSTNQVLHASGTGTRGELSAFVLKPGFKIELADAEPRVAAPVAMAFDEKGRLFVAEMRDSSEPANGAVSGRVRLLEGWEEDGTAQTSTIYAEHLRWPSALACYSGGLFVASGRDLIFLKDTHGSSSADVSQVLLTGFGASNTLTSQALLNNFNWGLDAKIHGATAGIGGTIVASNWPGAPVSLARSDLAFNPRSLAVFAESGPSISGLTFDSSGRRFVSDLGLPLRLVLYERRYVLRNPFFPAAPELVNAVNPATAVFRSTRGAKTNLLSPAWLAHAQGSLVYRGSAFGSNYVGNAFIPDPEAHLVHRVILGENGLGVFAERPADELRSEFLASSDPAFRPVQVVAGPDGALYIADVRDGHEQGRIYRVTPAGFKRTKVPTLAGAKTFELVSSLAASEGWRRDTAARLLFEQQDPAAVPLLSNMLSHSRLPLAREQALHGLANAAALREEHVLTGLRDVDPVVREHALLLSEPLLTNGIVSETLWSQMRGLSADPAVRVRLQLAFTLGGVRRADKLQPLRQILARDPANPWIQTAVLSSLGEGAGNFFVALAGNSGFRNSPAGNNFLRQLALMVGIKGRLDEVSQVANFLSRTQLEPVNMYGLLNALGEGLHRTRSSFALVDPSGVLLPLFNNALNIGVDPAFPEPLRVEAIRFLGYGAAYGDVADWLLLLCNPPPVPAIQSVALETVGRFDDPGVLPGFLKVWNVLSPALRHQALDALLSRSSRLGPVLEALEQRRLPAGDLSVTEINLLRTCVYANIRERALQLFGPVPLRRPQVVQQYTPALRLTGIAERGRNTFLARCVACHYLGGAGSVVGPDLTGARSRGKEQLLDDILEPAARLEPDFACSVVTTRQGELRAGIVSSENETTITLDQPGGVRSVWPRLNVESVYAQPWSLMPEGLEQGLSPQDMADLLQYLVTASP